MKGKRGGKTAKGKGKGVQADKSPSGKKRGGDEGRSRGAAATSSGVTDGGSLDERLEATAAKKNLSVTNVRSILHHLVKDQRVLKLVQRLAEKEEGGGGGGEKGESHTSDDWEELTAYEPRLTRSKVRQAVMSAVASGSLSADKIARLKSTSKEKEATELMEDEEDTEESSDEEYNPDHSSGDEEEEEEELETDEEMTEQIGEEMEEEEISEDLMESKNETTEVPTSSSLSTTATITSSSTCLPPPTTSTPHLPPHSDSSPCHSHSSIVSSTAVDSTQTTPTNSQTTPTNSQITPTNSQTTPTSSCTLTPLPRTPPRKSPPAPGDQHHQEEEEEECDREIRETALLLASMTGPQNTLSPLKYLTQQQQQQQQQQPAASDVNVATTSRGSNVVETAENIERGGVVTAANGAGHTEIGVVQVPARINTSTSENTQVSGLGSSAAAVSVGAAVGVDSGGFSLAGPSGEGVNVPHKLPVLSAGDVERLSEIPCLSPTITLAGTSEEEKIAQRTRSKHPLLDVSITSLEAGLGCVEGEDPPTPRELDPDELWWHQWLNSLTTDTLNDSLASHVTEEEEEEDGEYNFLADCLREEEREEFRNDRAVRIPRKEVDDLITELLNPSVEVSGGRLLSDDGLDLTGAYLLETLGVLIPTLADQSLSLLTMEPPAFPLPNEPAPPTTSSPCSCYLSTDQTRQLWTQIQQHFQLLLQTFVLARFEPSLVFVSQVAAQALDELSRWCSSTKEKGKGVWYIPDLQDGLDLVKALDPYNESAVKLTPSAGNPPKVPEGAQRVFLDTLLFWNYPHFLPATGFTPLTTNSASVSKYFTPQEECLLVLGMEHYGSNAWQEIQTNVLPTKTLKQLKLRVKNRCSKRSGSNAIKEYKKTKKLPQITDDIITEVPQWILTQHKKTVSKEKEEIQKKQKQIDQVRKILINSASKIAASSREQRSSESPVRDTTTPTAVGASSDSPSDSAASSSTMKPQSTSLPSTATLPGGKRTASDAGGGCSVAKKPRVLGSKSVQSKGGRREPKRAADTVRDGCGGETGDECVVRSGRGASLEHLLLAAGVEPSDPMSRFSFHFLREVKKVVGASKPGTYQQFIQLLQEYCQRQWRPSELYSRVRELFEPWPHLVSLFTEFLTPQDCLEANVLEEKHDVENVKSFIHRLQEKYTDAPLELREIVEKLKQLDNPSVSRQMVCESLFPLIRAHQDLTEDLRRLLFHLAPPPRDDDRYEEITLNGNTRPDDFEEVTLH